MPDVTAIGELLIDFTPASRSPAGNVLFEQNPGGAPANLLAALVKLGGEGAFIGKVGDDQFGRFLQRTLREVGIQTGGLRFTKEAETTLAFVHLDERGDRSFSFYRRPGADTLLTAEEIDYTLIDRSRVFHFGSLSLTDEPARTATLKAAVYARGKGKIISYDPNYRPPLWKSEAAAREGMALGLGLADIIKLSEVELEFLTGESDAAAGCRMLRARGGRLILVTLGPRGCFYGCERGEGHLPTYDTKIVDTTGAGDAFLGGFLYQMLKLDLHLDNLDLGLLEDAVDFANAVGALCVGKKGGIPAMPTLDEAEGCRRSTPKLVWPRP